MRKLKVQDAEIMKIALQQEIVRTEEARYDHRLHGPDGHLKIPHPWPGQNPPPQGRQNGILFSCFSFLTQVF